MRRKSSAIDQSNPVSLRRQYERRTRIVYWIRAILPMLFGRQLLMLAVESRFLIQPVCPKFLVSIRRKETLYHAIQSMSENAITIFIRPMFFLQNIVELLFSSINYKTIKLKFFDNQILINIYLLIVKNKLVLLN